MFSILKKIYSRYFRFFKILLVWDSVFEGISSLLFTTIKQYWKRPILVTGLHKFYKFIYKESAHWLFLTNRCVHVYACNMWTGLLLLNADITYIALKIFLQKFKLQYVGYIYIRKIVLWCGSHIFKKSVDGFMSLVLSSKMYAEHHVYPKGDVGTVFQLLIFQHHLQHNSWFLKPASAQRLNWCTKSTWFDKVERA